MRAVEHEIGAPGLRCEEARERRLEGEAHPREPARRLGCLLGESPGQARSARRLEHGRLDLVQGADHAPYAHRSVSQDASSSGKGAPWNSVMRNHLSERGSKRVAPKKASLQRKMSIGRSSAPIRLPQISE